MASNSATLGRPRAAARRPAGSRAADTAWRAAVASGRSGGNTNGHEYGKQRNPSPERSVRVSSRAPVRGFTRSARGRARLRGRGALVAAVRARARAAARPGPAWRAAGASAAGPPPPATERRIRFRIDEQPIEEQIDRLRHHLDGIERAVVERMIGALNRASASMARRAAWSLVKKSTLDCTGTVPSSVPWMKIVGAKLVADVSRRRCRRDVLGRRLALGNRPSAICALASG